ncbi:hypothetical protein [Gryllotalpicola ginsengisoli]|uniref:hypothetical protein n=1 Tax=Gryllotalpicola ginsengisoli TaxID=444608 RepID=UPI0012DDC232|nr:hypothetical protein [Gryllotalpicola ginsengisoli]
MAFSVPDRRNKTSDGDSSDKRSIASRSLRPSFAEDDHGTDLRAEAAIADSGWNAAQLHRGQNLSHWLDPQRLPMLANVDELRISASGTEDSATG